MTAKPAQAYAHQLDALLPPGVLWRREAGSTLAAVMTALAQELARVDLRATALINESDPRTLSETLADWERMLALPDPCVSFDQTTAERAAGVLAKYIAQGGQSPAYFVDVAAALGFTITITEFQPFTVGDDCTWSVYGTPWAYAWRVNAPLHTVESFSVADAVDDPLRWWDNEILECVLKKLKPAHTYLLFAYS